MTADPDTLTSRTPLVLHPAPATLERMRAEDVLAWAIAMFPGRLAVTVSFGGGGLVLAHMLSRVDPTVPVLFIDTGMLFPETLAFQREIADRYGLTIRTLAPLHDPGPLYETDADACCAIRKVEPLRRALADFDAWASAVRREQTTTRAGIGIVEHHERDGAPLVKVHPLASWSRDDVERYRAAHDIPRHPLAERGYTSIGCWPCTRATRPGESERAGRWSGQAKTECGIHTFTVRREA